MASKSKKSNTPRRDQPEVWLDGDPDRDVGTAIELHTKAVPGMVYANALSPQIKPIFKGCDLSKSAMLYAEDVMDRMAPRDPLEEMLIGQMLATHGRVLHLNRLATLQTRLDSIRILNEYADKASNTYRRQMLALAEYRRPPRSGDIYAAIQQANIAGQQVVQNHEPSQTRNATNEQASTMPDEAPQTLPAHTGGTGLASGNGETHQTLDAQHRPQNTRGQDTVPDECVEAWGAVGRSGRASGDTHRALAVDHATRVRRKRRCNASLIGITA